MRLCYALLLGVLAACGGGNGYSTNPPSAPPPPPPPPAPGTVFVTISDNQFTPDTTTIAAGTPVRWTNTGSAVHSARSDSGTTINSGGLAGPHTDSYGYPVPGATYTRTFSQSGTFAYHCEFHTGMNAVVVVTP